MENDIRNTLDQRRSTHGDFNLQAACTQELIAVLAKYGERSGIRLQPNMAESLHMQCHKQARIVCGDPFLHDSWHDIAGYATLVADDILRCQTAEKIKAQKDTADYGRPATRRPDNLPTSDRPWPGDPQPQITGSARIQVGRIPADLRAGDRNSDQPESDAKSAGPANAAGPGFSPRSTQDVPR